MQPPQTATITNNMGTAEPQQNPTTPGRKVLRVVVSLLVGLFLILQVSCQSVGSTVDPSAQPANPPPLTPAPVAMPIAAPALVPSVSFRLQPDLWRELRASFTLEHHVDKKRVQQELRWLREHPDYLERLQPRLQRYLGYIHSRVHARGMPGELALLPVVESALDPYAFSPGGAAGLWQFIPSTGRRFGLSRNWWYDGRRDPIAATEAALDYLQNLHDRFGDWQLAVAAYNAGEGSVMRAQKRGPRQGSFWQLPLPRETRAYVPRLLALSALVADPGEYGMQLPDVRPDIPFSVVNTGGQIDLAVAANHLGLDLDTLYEWNPALNQWGTPPAGPHRLVVPGSTTERFQARIAEIPEEQRVAWKRIKVASGDTLSSIAHRHNTDVTSLRTANKLRTSTIRVGQALYIPQSAHAADNYPPIRGRRDATYVVRPGDSLWTIGRAHGVSTTKLMKANHVGPKDVLRVGQRLRIPIAPNAPNARGKTIRTVTYGVRRGDSLSTIATRFNVNVNDIASWNRLDVKNYLRPGQSLKLYVDVTAGD